MLPDLQNCGMSLKVSEVAGSSARRFVGDRIREVFDILAVVAHLRCERNLEGCMRARNNLGCFPFGAMPYFSHF